MELHAICPRVFAKSVILAAHKIALILAVVCKRVWKQTKNKFVGMGKEVIGQGTHKRKHRAIHKRQRKEGNAKEQEANSQC